MQTICTYLYNRRKPLGKHEKKKDKKQPQPAPRDNRGMEHKPANTGSDAPDGVSGNWS